jgi:hypothetical protein
MMKTFVRRATRALAFAAAAAGLVSAGGCASYVTSEVTAFTAWSGGDTERTYTFKRTEAQQNSIEQSTYEAEVADELSRYNFHPAAPPASHYAIEIQYGSRDSTVVVRQPAYVDPWYMGSAGPYWYRGYPPYGGWAMFPPSYVDQVYATFMHGLTIRFTDRASGREVYKVTATTTSGSPSLVRAMPYLVRSALADFPLENGVTRVVQLPADLRAASNETAASNERPAGSAAGASPAAPVK